jgi:hypothetical protein
VSGVAPVQPVRRRTGEGRHVIPFSHTLRSLRDNDRLSRYEGV